MISSGEIYVLAPTKDRLVPVRSLCTKSNVLPAKDTSVVDLEM